MNIIIFTDRIDNKLVLPEHFLSKRQRWCRHNDTKINDRALVCSLCLSKHLNIVIQNTDHLNVFLKKHNSLHVRTTFKKLKPKLNETLEDLEMLIMFITAVVGDMNILNTNPFFSVACHGISQCSMFRVLFSTLALLVLRFYKHLVNMLLFGKQCLRTIRSKMNLASSTRSQFIHY